MAGIIQALRDRVYDAEDLLVGINREVVPVLKQLRKAVVRLLNDDGEVAVSSLEPGTAGQYLRTATGPPLTAAWQDLGTVPLANLSPAGAATGDVPTFNGTVYAPAAPSGGAVTMRSYIYGNVTYVAGPGYRLTDLNFDAPGAGETLTPVGSSPAWTGALNEMKANSSIIVQLATSSIAHMTGGGEKNNMLGWVQSDPSGGNLIKVLYYVVAAEAAPFSIDFLVTILDPPS